MKIYQQKSSTRTGSRKDLALKGKWLIATVIGASLLSSCGSEDTSSTLSQPHSFAETKTMSLKQVTFRAKFFGIKYKKVVPSLEIRDFSDGPRIEYRKVEQKNLKELMKDMRISVDGDVGYYMHDFFNQRGILPEDSTAFEGYLSSERGTEFLEKFDLFIDVEDDSQTIELLTNAILASVVPAGEGFSLKLVDILTAIEQTENIDALMQKLQSNKEFYENMIENLKADYTEYLQAGF